MATDMNKEKRKERPVFTGVLRYFPDAIMEIAKVSLAGNQQHHPDTLQIHKRICRLTHRHFQLRMLS